MNLARPSNVQIKVRVVEGEGDLWGSNHTNAGGLQGSTVVASHNASRCNRCRLAYSKRGFHHLPLFFLTTIRSTYILLYTPKNGEAVENAKVVLVLLEVKGAGRGCSNVFKGKPRDSQEGHSIDQVRDTDRAAGCWAGLQSHETKDFGTAEAGSGGN